MAQDSILCTKYFCQWEKKCNKFYILPLSVLQVNVMLRVLLIYKNNFIHWLCIAISMQHFLLQRWLPRFHGQHSGTAGRVAFSQHQRPQFDPDLGCCVEFARSPIGFPPGAPVSSHIPKKWVSRSIIHSKLPPVCRGWLQKLYNIDLVWLMVGVDLVGRRSVSMQYLSINIFQSIISKNNN